MAKGIRRQRDPYRSLALPNAGSKFATPASLKTDLHYEKLGIYQRWTWDRFLRLATFLKITPYELGSLACVTHSQVEVLRNTNRLKLNGPGKNRPGALVLTLLETYCCRMYTKDIIESPFPNLNKAAP